jgi:hypothetical protein
LECAGRDGALDDCQNGERVDERIQSGVAASLCRRTPNNLAVAEGFEPSIAGLTIRCLTNLATPQTVVFDLWPLTLNCESLSSQDIKDLRSKTKDRIFDLAAAARFELAPTRLQDECSGAN